MRTFAETFRGLTSSFSVITHVVVIVAVLLSPTAAHAQLPSTCPNEVTL
jgi:hypothetical protein